MWVINTVYLTTLFFAYIFSMPPVKAIGYLCRHYAECFACITSFISCNNPMINRFHHYLHFTEEKTDTQRNVTRSPRY